jgi:hypothetical protein
MLSKVGVDLPYALFVEIGQSGSFARNVDNHLIKLSRLYGQAGFDIAQTFRESPVCKSREMKLVEARKRSNPVISLISFRCGMKRWPRKKIHEMSKYWIPRRS